MTDKIHLSRGIHTSSLAAVFPFVSNAIVDEKGLLIGENKLHVFVDFMRRDTEHLSSNMIVLGRPGSGKSYACKSIIAQLASCNTRVFILDPESETENLPKVWAGKYWMYQAENSVKSIRFRLYERRMMKIRTARVMISFRIYIFWKSFIA